MNIEREIEKIKLRQEMLKEILEAHIGRKIGIDEDLWDFGFRQHEMRR